MGAAFPFAKASSFAEAMEDKTGSKLPRRTPPIFTPRVGDFGPPPRGLFHILPPVNHNLVR